MRNRDLLVAVVVTLLVGSAFVQADTIPSTGSFAAVTASPSSPYTYSYVASDPTGGDGFNLPSQPVTGLAQFNPALGTLTGVTLDVSTNWSWQIDVYGTSTLIESDPSDIFFSLDFVQYFIGYDLGGGSTSVLIDNSDSPYASAYADGFEYPSDANYGDGILTGPQDITGSVTLADFIGLGDVTTLSAFLAFPSEASTFDITNLDDTDTYADLTMLLEGADVTLTYEYTPVPEPATLSLLAVSGLMLIQRRTRRRSAS